MEERAVVHAGHVPVTVVFEEKVQRLCPPIDVGEERGEADGVASGHLPSLPPRPRTEMATRVEEAAEEIHAAERGGDADVGLRAELEELLCRARRIVRER